MSSDATKQVPAANVDEPDCGPVSDPDDPTGQEEVDPSALEERSREVLGTGEADDFAEDAGDGADPTQEVSRRTFATPGGGFGGSEAPILRAMKIARRNGLVVTSTKRSELSTASDHHVSQTTAFAADLSNGSAPTPEMDAVAKRLAKLLGTPGFSGGVLTKVIGNLRFQLLYRTDVGGNHFNHVHIGCRVL